MTGREIGDLGCLMARHTCPRCGAVMPEDGRYSTSRRDNRTKICPGCGTSEALYDWFTATGQDVPETIVIREQLFYLWRTTPRRG